MSHNVEMQNLLLRSCSESSLLLKLTDEGEEYDDLYYEIYNAAESSGKLLVSSFLMDHV